MGDSGADRLAQIIAYKHDEVAALKRARSVASLQADVWDAEPPRGFADALLAVAAADGNALICEMKRRSPSAGEIRLERAPGDVARAYAAGGAACISVLTDGPSFGGAISDMREVLASVRIPVLRKDFMIDTIQILESRVEGADAVLLIMSVLSDAQAAELHATADELGMSVLLEAHDATELERALRLPSPLVGVNNRNLKTMTTDLGTTERLSGLMPPGKLLISESGVRTPADISRLRPCGARGFLVGESLMRAGNQEESVGLLVRAR